MEKVRCDDLHRCATTLITTTQNAPCLQVDLQHPLMSHCIWHFCLGANVGADSERTQGQGLGQRGLTHMRRALQLASGKGEVALCKKDVWMGHLCRNGFHGNTFRYIQSPIPIWGLLHHNFMMLQPQCNSHVFIDPSPFCIRCFVGWDCRLVVCDHFMLQRRFKISQPRVNCSSNKICTAGLIEKTFRP